MEPGELLAYRKRAVDPLEPVTYLRHRRGDQPKHKYSLVRFEAEEADGREEWVPDGRLKCPWNEAEEYVERELRWAAIGEASREKDSLTTAVGLALDELLPQRFVGHSSYRLQPNGVFVFQNLDELSDQFGMPLNVLTGSRTAFEESGSWVLPFEAAKTIAMKLAQLNPGVVIRLAEDTESKLAEEEWHDQFRKPLNNQQQDWRNSRHEQCRLWREWAGEQNNALRRETVESRAEVERLRSLVEQAITKLEANGHKYSAAMLRRSLAG